MRTPDLAQILRFTHAIADLAFKVSERGYPRGSSLELPFSEPDD